MRRLALVLLCAAALLVGGCFLFKSGILYEETWSDPNTTEWPLVSDALHTTSIAGGRYHFLLQDRTIWFCWNTSEGPFGDVQIDVDVKHEAGTNNLSAGGLVFRLGNGSNTYVFEIGPHGLFYIGKVVAGTWTALMTWTASAAIHQGVAENHLTVLADGASLTFLINGTEVAELTDSSHSTGRVGVCVDAFDPDVDAEKSFDNLVVREL